MLRVPRFAYLIHSPMSQRSLLNYAGIAILLAGLAAGEFIYWRSLKDGPGAGDDDSLALMYNSRVYERTVQTTVGTVGLVMDQWSRAIAKLGEPKPLAIAIAVVSVLAAGGCFVAASRMPRD